MNINGNRLPEINEREVIDFEDFNFFDDLDESELHELGENNQPAARVSNDSQAAMNAASGSARELFSRNTVSHPMIEQLNKKAEPLKGSEYVDQITLRMSEVYCSKESLTIGGIVDGQKLQDRIVAKIYGRCLLEHIEDLADEINPNSVIRGFTIVRKQQLGANIVDGNNGTSRIQATVLTVNNVPFLVVDAGNSSELKVVEKNKYYALGYYNNGAATRNSVALVKIGNQKFGGSDSFITSRRVLPSSTSFNPDEGKVYKIKDKSMDFKTPEDRKCINKIYEELKTCNLNDENDPFLSLLIKRINQARSTCGLSPLERGNYPSLIRQLVTLHATTMSSLG